MDANNREHRRRLVVERWAAELGEPSLAAVVTRLEALARQGLTAPRRRDVMRWLSMAGLPCTRPLFIASLHDPAVRRYAATGLGRAGQADDAALLHPLLADESLPRPTRGRVAQALGWLGSPRSVEPLIGRHVDPARLVRKASAKALGRIAARHAEVAERLLVDTDAAPEPRAVLIVEALGYLGTAGAARRLLAQLERAAGPATVLATARLSLARVVRRDIAFPRSEDERARTLDVLALDERRSRECVRRRRIARVTRAAPLA